MDQNRMSGGFRGVGIVGPGSRKFQIAGGVALAVAGLLAAGLFLLDPFNRSENAAYDGPREKVTLGLARESLAALAMIARERGFFEQAGLDVTVKEYNSGQLAMAGFLAGEVAMATAADIPIVFESMSRQDFGIVATIGSSDNEPRIVARKDRGIRAPADLRDKHIATQKASAVHFFLHMFLLQNGLSGEDVKLSYLKANELVKALVEGEIDAFSMREPFISQAAKQLGENAVVFASPGLYRKTFNVVATPALIKERPETTRRLVQALLRAETFALQQPDQARAIVAKALGAQPADIAAIWSDSLLKVSLDQSLLVSLEDEARWILGSKLTEAAQAPSYFDLIHVGALKTVDPVLVSLIH